MKPGLIQQDLIVIQSSLIIAWLVSTQALPTDIAHLIDYPCIANVRYIVQM